MTMSTVEPACPKCGGKMKRGNLQVPMIHARTQILSPFMQGGIMGGLSSIPEETEEKLYWEEKTGEKKGFFKREETKRIVVSGYRCTLCGYVELYAKEK